MRLGFDLSHYLGNFNCSLGCRSNWWRDVLCGGARDLNFAAEICDSLVTGWHFELLVCGGECVVLVPDEEKNVVQRLMQE